MLATIGEELRRYPNVTGYYLGMKRKGGRSTGRLSLVVCVSSKTADSGEPLPAAVEDHSEGRRRLLPVDVQELRTAVPMTAVLGPGDAVLDPDTNALCGTVGVAVVLPATATAAVTTAGHVVLRHQATPLTVDYAPGAGPVVRFHSGGAGGSAGFQGQVLRASVTEWSDYALIAASAGSARNLFDDRFGLGSPLRLTSADVDNRRLFALTTKGRVGVTVRGLEATIPFSHIPLMRGLILTDLATEGGDSGCCVVDSDSRPVGTLVGGVAISGRFYSVFMPLEVLLSREGARLL